MKLVDLDFDRKQLHVKEGKGRKDRYVLLSDHLIRGLKKYINTDGPVNWLFNGQPDVDGNPTGYSQRGIQWIVKQTRKNIIPVKMQIINFTKTIIIIYRSGTFG